MTLLFSPLPPRTPFFQPLLLSLFAFSPSTWSAWDTLCAGQPYRSGTRIELPALDALTHLHDLGVPGFESGEPLPSPAVIAHSCENYARFRVL